MFTVLCVEDEERLRHDIAAELKYAGHDVLQANDGQQGLEAIIQYKPDIVVSDISMPHMDGLELLSKVRSDYPELAEMPFIFLSALADRRNMLDGVKLGADDYLTKPIDYEMLVAKVETALHRSQSITKKKEDEHVKLYKALKTEIGSGEAKRIWPTVEPRKIVLVGRSEQGLWGIQRFLEEIGHRVEVFTSGRSYLYKVEEEKVDADLTLLWFQSDDMQANMVLRMAASRSGIYVLMVPERLYSPGMNLAANGFHDSLGLPVDEEELFERVSKWTEGTAREVEARLKQESKLEHKQDSELQDEPETSLEHQQEIAAAVPGE